MRKEWIIGTVLGLGLLLPATPLVQAQEDDKTYLEGLIEGALSGEDREVTVTGFKGALSSNATLERLTIADEDGIWLTLENASLVWSRAALLRGRLDVQELTADSIDLQRLPKSEKTVSPEDAEAKPFTLPDLPVSVELEQISANQLTLGPDLIGEAATLSMSGSISLIDGAGDIALDMRRLDRDDALTLDAGYANETQQLRIDLDFQEGPGGLIGKSLNVPGTPSLALTVKGDAPLSDFTATIGLSSDGTPRLGGQVAITTLPPLDDAENAEDQGSAGYSFDADLSGDLRPLVTPDLHPFFGEEARLELRGALPAGGGTDLNRLHISSAAMDLSGRLSMGTDGWPQSFDLAARIKGDGPLRLPTAAPAATVDQITLDATYDAQTGDSWTASIEVDGFARDGVRFDHADLGAVGQITRQDGQSIGASIRFALEQFTHSDAALTEAVGSAPEGLIVFDWPRGDAVDISRLDLRSGDMELTASGQIDGLTEGFPVAGQAVLITEDLSRFAAIADRPLAGAAEVAIRGSGVPLSGAFDLDLSAATTDLELGEPRADPLLQGRSVLRITAQRSETGTRLDWLELSNPALSLQADGQLNAQSGQVQLMANLENVALVEPRLDGPIAFETGLTWAADGALEFTRLQLTGLTADLRATGRVVTSDPTLPASGTLSLKAEDLSRLAQLAGRPLAGSLDLMIDGKGALTQPSVDGQITLNGTDLVTGVKELDRITRGDIRFDAILAYGEGWPFIDSLSLVSPNLTVSAESDRPGAPVIISANLSDLALVAPGVNGPARLEGTVTQANASGDVLDVALNFDGPADVAARIEGQFLEYGQRADLAITGRAPTALANGALAPNSIEGPLRFDLRLNGKPGLPALSGDIRFDGLRMALPNANTALTDLTGTLRLAGGTLAPDITGSTGHGGQFRVQGPITLTAPYDADLTATLEALGVVNPQLFETTLNGRLRVQGPLIGGAGISGAIDLGKTELRVPSGGAGASGALQGIRHIGEPAGVRRTRARAGLIETGTSKGPKAAFPLNLTIRAPKQIFVRGRGLDAELGGELELGGTTADVTAAGVFELIRGRLDILNQRLELTEGLIDLRGALDPFLRFVARTQSNEYTIDVTVEGLASEPEILFSSAPELPQEEVLAQLLFGRSFSDISALQAAQLVGAVATLSGKGGGGLTGKFRSILGLSDFDVSTSDEGATQLKAGAYISDNIYSEIVADSDGNNQINLNLDITRSLTVKGGASNNGDTGVGVFFEKDY